MQVTLNFEPEFNLGDCLYYFDDQGIATLMVIKILLEDVEISPEINNSVEAEVAAYVCLDQNGLIAVVTPNDIKRIGAVKTKQALINKIEKDLCLKTS